MAQYCKLAGRVTNCTDNCRICLKEEAKTREIKVGDKVRYIAEDSKEDKESGFYPPRGTIGVVVRIENDAAPYLIKWPEGTTKGDGFWYTEKDGVELVSAYIHR